MSIQPPGATLSAASPPFHRVGKPTELRRARWIISLALIVTMLLTGAYAAVSLVMASQMVYAPPQPLIETPANLGLSYRNVTFYSRGDHLRLNGWLIPGILPDGRLTVDRTLIVVHGTRANRTDIKALLLNLCDNLAHKGFAVLAFDMHGQGQSQPAPISFGLFEQRDVLGAVDFLRHGTPPYPALGRSRLIGGWGLSMGGATLVMAAAQEPAIRAVVLDSVYTDFAPVLEREVPKQGGMPAFMTPGALNLAYILYGIDYYAARPVDYIARIAPRPVFLIQGANDELVPPSNLAVLVRAASAPADAHVTSWSVPGTAHSQAFHMMGQQYVDRVVAFYTTALGPDTSQARP